jgi:RimJ/RimL family protein N-acetyltransferase
MVFRSIDDESELEFLVSLSAKRAVSARWVAGLLERRESRPQWCRMALSANGDLLAAHALDSWSPDGEPGPAPTFVHLLGHADEAAAAALLTHDLRCFGAESVEARVVLDVDAAPDLRMLRESQPRVLSAADFTLEVDRVRIQWLSRSPTPRPSGVLTFRSAATFPAGDLVEVFAQVGDGSVDHGMVTGRAGSGRCEEAARRVRHAWRRPHEDGWFVVGVDRAGVPVGYVQSAMVDGERPILAEIGVVAARRGRRYVDELLAYGTAVLADRGVPRIGSDTDVANRAMRAAFARAGYVEFASRRDFRWRAAPRRAATRRDAPRREAT